MKQKTPVTGILIWVLLAVLISVEAMEVVYGLLQGTNLHTPFIAGCTVGAAFLVMLVIGGIANECHKRFAREKDSFVRGYYIGGFFFLVISVITVIAVYCMRFQSAGVFPESEYSLTAVVGQGQFTADTAVDTVPGGRLYLYFLHSLYYLFGNKAEVAVYSQFLLYVITLIVIFFTVNSMAGIYSAAIATALFGCLTRVFVATLTADPVLLLTVAVFFPLMLLGFVIRAASQGKYKHPFLVIMVFCILTVLLVFGAEFGPYLAETTFDNDGWQTLFAFRFGRLLSGEYDFLWNRPDDDYILNGVIYGGVVLGLSRYFYKKEVTGLFLPLGLLACMSVASFSLNPALFAGITSAFWCAVAGQGIGFLFTPERKSEPVTEKEENSDSDTLSDEKSDSETKTEVKLEVKPEVKPVPEIVDLDKEEKTVTTTEPEKPAVLPGAPLPNPLPVPKKKERKENVYPHTVPEDKLCFDIETDENDDFDLK